MEYSAVLKQGWFKEEERFFRLIPEKAVGEAFLTVKRVDKSDLV